MQRADAKIISDIDICSIINQEFSYAILTIYHSVRKCRSPIIVGRINAAPHL